jgi:uncharacterized protein
VRSKLQATYVDTSVWCAYCFNEAGSENAVEWLGRANLAWVGTSWWTETEFASALGIQLRKKALTKKQAASARERFVEVLDMVNLLNVTEHDFREAASYCFEASRGHRGGDALHLAIAQRHGCTTLATLDLQMQANARRLGLKLIELI